MPTSSTYMPDVKVRFSEHNGRKQFKIIINFEGLRELQVWTRISLMRYQGEDEDDYSSDGLSDDTIWWQTSVWASCASCHRWRLAVCERRTDMSLCPFCRLRWYCDTCGNNIPPPTHNCQANNLAWGTQKGINVRWARDHDPPYTVSTYQRVDCSYVTQDAEMLFR